MSEGDPRPALPEDRVGDDERLYRSVREKFFIRHSETEVTVSEHAYNDARRQPSKADGVSESANGSQALQPVPPGGMGK